MLFLVILAVLQFFPSMQAAISRVEKKERNKRLPSTLFLKNLGREARDFFTQPYGDTRTTKLVNA